MSQLWDLKISHVKLHKILHEMQALIFKFWVIFDKVMSVYSQNIAKKNHLKSPFGAIPDMQVLSTKPFLKKPLFLKP